MFANLGQSSFIDYFDYPLFLLVVILAGIIGYIKSLDSCKGNFNRPLITQDASTLLKAMSCTVIVLHHYALRYQENAAEKFFAVHGGTIALVTFFFLSAYGVCLSEILHPLGLRKFFKKRFSKIIKPFWIVTFLFLFIYTLINLLGNYVFVAEDKYWLIKTISDYGVFDYLMCFVNITKFDGAMWFVEVILLSYLVFFIAKTFFSIENNQLEFMVTYCFGIIIMGGVFLLGLPAHYYRNLWSLILGMFFALFGEYLIKHKWVMVEVGCCVYGYVLIQSYIMEEMYWYSMGCILAIAFIVSGLFISYHNVFSGDIIRIVGGASYFVYLIHEKVFSLLDIFWGKMTIFIPLIVVFSISVCINWIYVRANNEHSIMIK